MSIVIATTGPVTQTGIITETNFAALRIPANTIGRNGLVEVRTLWSYTNSANNKTFNVRFNPTAGSIAGGAIGPSATVTTTATAQGVSLFGNNNATNQQAYFNVPNTTPYGVSAQGVAIAGIDTTADAYVNINGSITAAGETLTLQHAAVVIFPVP